LSTTIIRWFQKTQAWLWDFGPSRVLIPCSWFEFYLWKWCFFVKMIKIGIFWIWHQLMKWSLSIPFSLLIWNWKEIFNYDIFLKFKHRTYNQGSKAHWFSNYWNLKDTENWKFNLDLDNLHFCIYLLKMIQIIFSKLCHHAFDIQIFFNFPSIQSS